jgi:hypothetical protein
MLLAQDGVPGRGIVPCPRAASEDTGMVAPRRERLKRQLAAWGAQEADSFPAA